MSDDFTLAKLLDIQLQKHSLPALYDTLLLTFLENLRMSELNGYWHSLSPHKNTRDVRVRGVYMEL